MGHQETWEIPLVSMWKRPDRSTGLNNAPGPMTDLASIGSACANTKRQDIWNPEAKT